MHSELTKTYCQRYAVHSIHLAEVPGVVDEVDAVCDVIIDFSDGYRVHFKLPTDATPASRGVTALDASGEIETAPGDGAVDEMVLASFFADIESRLEKIQHEQSVQNITYLGNTFVLNNKTVFDVVADEEGRLTIEMHRGAQRQQAMLLASSLLDGLYDGSIILKK